MDDPDMGTPRVYRGINAVLQLHTRWGKLPIITDTEQFGDVGITVPSEMRPGDTLSADERRGYVRIGGQAIAYESRELEGTIHVVEVTPEAVVLDLDLLARAPVIDLHDQGEKRVQGRVRAVFREGPAQ